MVKHKRYSSLADVNIEVVLMVSTIWLNWICGYILLHTFSVPLAMSRWGWSQSCVIAQKWLKTVQMRRARGQRITSG